METKSGNKLHPIGIGTWTMGGEREAVIDPELDQKHIKAISYSISIGQNHIDTAELYGNGHTDELVAQAIKGKTREDLFIANKLWETSFGESETLQGVEKMLERMQTDYIDLLYIHSTFDGEDWINALKPIERLINERVVRYFGVSNFNVQDMEISRKNSDLKIAANQVHFNVCYKDQVDNKFREYAKINDVQIVAYRPVERGALNSNETLLDITTAHNATQEQIALAWLLQQGILTIPKSSTKDHIDINFGSMDIKLSPEDISRLNSL